MTNGRRGSATQSASVQLSDPLKQRKQELRREATDRRRLAHAKLGGSAGVLLRDSFLANVAIDPQSVVSGFAPIRDEIDVIPLLEMLAARGHGVALPVVTGRMKPLTFRAWEPGMTLMKAAFGVRIPPESSPEVTPDVVLVPILAFDASCRRIGYGGGYYDRTLDRLRTDRQVLAIGVAFADQEVDEVPVGENDQILDLIVTERSLIRPRG